jgi:hypothetical protein
MRLALGTVGVNPVVVNIGFIEVQDMQEHPCYKLDGIDDFGIILIVSFVGLVEHLFGLWQAVKSALDVTGQKTQWFMFCGERLTHLHLGAPVPEEKLRGGPGERRRSSPPGIVPARLALDLQASLSVT